MSTFLTIKKEKPPRLIPEANFSYRFSQNKDMNFAFIKIVLR